MTEKLLAIREKNNVTCTLSMIDNGENKRYIFKVNKTIYWYFDTIKEYEDGTVSHLNRLMKLLMKIIIWLWIH